MTQTIGTARRSISRAIKESRDWCKEGEPSKGVACLQAVESLAIKLRDPMAERGLMRAMSACYRAQGATQDAIACLLRGIYISSQIGAYTGDADMFGEIGYLYVELGDYDAAQLYYDECLKALDEDKTTVVTDWDC